MKGWTSSTLTLAFLVISAASCSDSVAAPTPLVASRPLPNALSVVPFGAESRAAAHPCRTGPHRQFDFWVGEWNVTSGGTAAGTNDVRSEVDGCTVAEYWVGVGGVPGWSLNMYDPETASWHQHWVDPSGRNLFLSGGLQGNVMVIGGPRVLPNGTTVVDRIAYTPFPTGGLQQVWDVSTDGGQTFPTNAFNGVYTAAPNLQHAPEVTLAACSTPPYHAADFLLGAWEIRTSDGKYVGRTEFSSHLSSCVLVQTTKGRATYEAKAFLAFGRLVGQWRLTHVGSDGERLFLSGTMAGGSLVLEGVEVEAGAPILVRLTYSPASADRVDQRWERSSDNGVTWETVASNQLERR